jgi:sec-independent protein translocase protein TatA
MFEGLLQPVHLLIILVIALIVFGPKRLPDLGKGLGKSIRDFKDAMDETTSSVKNAGEKLMQDVGVSPDDAKKLAQSVQTVRQVRNPRALVNTLGQKALDSTGLKDAVSDTPGSPAADAPPPAEAKPADSPTTQNS